MKQKLGYIDHSFHKKTKSTYFLRDVLADNFDVIDIWDESWNGGDALTAEFINSKNFEYVLFFQSLLPIKELKKIKAKIIWVPMYDGVVDLKNYFWLELSAIKIKIISFSETLTDKIKNFGLDVFEVKYFFNPSDLKAVADYSQKMIFFWQRTKFCFNDVKKLLGDQKIDQFILKLDPDPGYKPLFPSQEDINKYNIKIVQGFLSKDEYMEMLSSSNIFISSREFEGIGMSFIEAMSMGLAVVAVDNPTMNEYIKHGENGYLLKLNQLNEIDFSEFARIGKNAKNFCEAGYGKWKNDNEKIIKFILSDFKKPIGLSFFVRGYIKIIQTVRSILRKMIVILRHCKIKNL